MYLRPSFTINLICLSNPMDLTLIAIAPLALLASILIK